MVLSMISKTMRAWPSLKGMVHGMSGKTIPVDIKHVCTYWTARTKSRANLWISREVINRMFEKDKRFMSVQFAVVTQSVLMGHYGKLHNNVTQMIKQNKKKYFQYIYNTSRSNLRKFWS